MGYTVWVHSDLSADRPLTYDEVNKVESITNHYGEQAFQCDDSCTVSYWEDEHHGHSPVTDDIEAPLEKLFILANENGFVVSGALVVDETDYFEGRSVWIIEDNKFVRTIPEQIYDATDEELQAELDRRRGK